MPLRTTTTLPSGGWLFNQKDNSGAVVKKYKSMSPFKEFCTEVLKLRVNNKYNRASIGEVMEDVENATCERLGFDPTFCIQKKTPFTFNPIKLFQASAQHLRESARAVAARASNLTDGFQILKEWFGDGAMPVPAELSQARADTCSGRLSGNPCPYNKAGLRPIEAAAEIIRKQAEQKSNMSLFVEGEDQLHTCTLCYCVLSLKCHVPIETIEANTPNAMIDKMRAAYPLCWQVQEISAMKQPTPAL